VTLSWPRSKVWEQVYVPSLPFETLDSFLAVPEPPEPWVLVDLADIWVPNKGVPAPVRQSEPGSTRCGQKRYSSLEYSSGALQVHSHSSGSVGSELLPKRGRPGLRRQGLRLGHLRVLHVRRTRSLGTTRLRGAAARSDVWALASRVVTGRSAERIGHAERRLDGRGGTRGRLGSLAARTPSGSSRRFAETTRAREPPADRGA
jgi:hypothetical protein